jgi:WD40 repeat protein
LDRPEKKPTLLNNEKLTIDQIDLSPDGKTLATVSEVDRTVHLLRVDRPEEKPLLLDSLTPTTIVRFSPDGNNLASFGSQGLRLLRLTDTQAGPITLRSDPRIAFFGGFSGDGRRLVTKDAIGQIQIWTVPEEELLRTARETAGRELTDAERARFKIPRSSK